MKYWLAIVAFSFVGLSGCLAEEDSLENSGAKQDSNIENLDGLQLEGCMYLGSSIEDPDSKSMKIPEGWRYDSVDTPMHQLKIFSCARGAIGELEREQITLLLEDNYGPEVPDGCVELLGGTEYAKLVRGIYTTDKEFSSKLEEAIGFAVGTLVFSLENSTDPLIFERIDWETSDGGFGVLEFMGPPENLQNTVLESELFFFDTNSKLTVIDFRSTRLDATSAPEMIVGSIGGTHHNPSPIAPNWLSDVGHRINVRATAEFHHFEDTLCERPSS